MYSLFTVAGVLKTWQTRYCDADYSQCARYQQSQQGMSVPINLMPNGSLLKRPK